MASYKLSNYIILRNIAVKDKHLPYLFVLNRFLCSKDNEIKDDTIRAKDSSTKENREHAEDTVKAEASSPKDKTSKDDAKSAAKQKLMSLLSNIKIAADKPTKTPSELNLAKPLKRISKKERLRHMEANIVTPEKQMDIAVKAVASSFKDSEKVESELTSKVSSLRLSKTELVKEDIEKENTDISNEMNEKLMSSVEEVADTISESPIPPRSELAKRLMRLSIDQKLQSEKKSMRSVIKGMTVELQQTAPPPKTSIEVRKHVKTPPVLAKVGKVNLFGSAPLNIFTPGAETKAESTNTFWKELQERELKLMTQFAPANAFEEMIMWTEQEKHWKFPIDNQIDMGEEENIGFHEHVFLEHHLKGFPTKGPIHQFMELVLVGLSKNPYITVERKIDHIEWFRNYFNEKEEILREEGAID